MTQKQKYIAIVAGPALFILGYLLGWYKSPTKVVVTDRLQAVEKQVIVKEVDTDAVIKAVRSVAKDLDTHRTRTRTRLPDGTVTDVSTEDQRAHETVNASSSTVTDTSEGTVAAREQTVTQEHTEERLMLKEPEWILGIQGGVSIPRLLGRDVPIYQIPGLSLGAFVVGLNIDRRLFGPFYGGAWVNNQGSVGLELRFLH